MDRYDADLAPDAARWLALDEGQRRALIAAAHATPDRLHDGVDQRVHATLHAVVETQAATNDPPATRRTLERLAASGLRRHAAVHMVAEVLLEWIGRGEPFDGQRYAARLDALDAGAWLGDRMRRDLGPPRE